MGATVLKSLLVAEDVAFGFGDAEQTRDGNRVNASHIPYTPAENVETALTNRYTKTESDNTFALLAGNSLQVFSVATPVGANDAVPLGYLSAALADKANLADVLTLTNEVEYTPLYNFNPATKLYVDSTVSQALDNYLALDNASIYTPIGEYNPSTKKYADDLMLNNVTAVGALKIRPASSIVPTVTGQMVFELTNDTTLVIKVMGYDLVVRSATIILS